MNFSPQPHSYISNSVPVSFSQMLEKCLEIKKQTPGILFSHKKEWSLTICDNMDGPGRCYTKWNKSEKDKFHLYVESKKQNKWTNRTKQK